MEFNWQILLFTYLILAFAFYGIIHWIEVVLDLPISEHEQNPNQSYENLRRIVQTIVSEVIKSPEFHNQRGFSNVDATQTQASFEPKVYEDLIATAVINKIVETYNDKKFENSSGIHSAGSDLDSNYNTEKINNNFILNQRSSSTDFNTDRSAFYGHIESTSMKTSAIIDELFREKLGKANSDSSTNSTSSTRSELFDYIQNQKISLPDLEFRQRFSIGSYNLDEIESDIQSFHTESSDIEANYSDISDNWLFRKPQNNSTSSVVLTTAPVGMLVPSPTEDCKTLIGDRIADEISDLSEAGSDSDSITDDNEIINDRTVSTEENDNNSEVTQNAYDLPHVLLESKTLIGGKNEMSSFEKIERSFIELLEPDSLVSVQSLNGQSPAISEAKNNLILIGERIKYQNDCLTCKMDSSTNTELKMAEFIGLESNESLIHFDSLEMDNADNKIYMNSMQNIQDRKPIPADRKMGENENRFADETEKNIRTVFSSSKTFASRNERLLHKYVIDSNEEYNNFLEWYASFKHQNKKIDYSNDGLESLNHLKLDSLEKNQCNNIGPAHKLESQINMEHDRTVECTDLIHQTNINGITSNIIENEHSCNNLPGSIAEREHMKWQNAVELPNNPYSAEALQRRLSKTQSQLINIDGLAGIKNIESVDEAAMKINDLDPPSDLGPMKVALGPIKHNSERYARDYYINDAKTASGSREQRTCADLNLHRAIDDEHLENENDDDSLVIGDFQVVSDTSRGLQKNKEKIILNKAEKLNREYHLFETDAVAVDECTKLSLSSESTDDSYIPPPSLNHYDDSLLTTLSDESECATAVHVYNLSKRETKILRHDIIKRSRIPIGDSPSHPFDDLINDQDNSKDGSISVSKSTIKDFSNRLAETKKSDEIKSIRSTVQLKSIHLSRSPREMDNVQLLDSIDDPVTVENIEIHTITATKKLIENERNNVYVESKHKYIGKNDTACESLSSEKVEQLPKDNGYNLSNEERIANCTLSIDPVDPIDGNIEASDASDLSEYISLRQLTDEIHPFKDVQDYERNSDVMVQVSEHKEKSVIEEDVISLLPSVKALAKTFSQHVNQEVPKQFHRPKANGNIGNDESGKNGTPRVFNHAYHPIAPGYSITARSLSNKFREELRNSAEETMGRMTPERPSSPVLVPGILKNTVSFFEKLRNQ